MPEQKNLLFVIENAVKCLSEKPEGDAVPIGGTGHGKVRLTLMQYNN